MMVTFNRPSALANDTRPAYYVGGNDESEVWLLKNYTGTQINLFNLQGSPCESDLI